MSEPGREIRHAERALAVHRAYDAVAVGWHDSHQGFADLIQRFGVALGCPIGSVWTLDGASQALSCWDFFTAGHLEAGEFERVTRRVPLVVGDGIPGRVWASEAPLFSPDLYLNLQKPRHASARAVGLRSAISFPVSGAAGPLAVVALYSLEHRDGDDELDATLRSVGRALGNLIESRHDAVGGPMLSERELQVLQLAADGKNGPEIADELVLSALTVKSHLAHIYAKVGIRDRAGAVAYALRRGMIR